MLSVWSSGGLVKVPAEFGILKHSEPGNREITSGIGSGARLWRSVDSRERYNTKIKKEKDEPVRKEGRGEEESEKRSTRKTSFTEDFQ